LSVFEVGSAAGELRLRGDGERELALSELAAGRPLALVFLRHFG